MRIARFLAATAAVFALTTGVASAQIGTTTPAAPGVPATGAGGDASSTLIVSATAALAAVLGAAYLLRRKTQP